ncbi:MAG: polyphenol oxidase family protein, partial [Spirochaetales bacterium]|nr:polyphenol oxidase family protein [Spirochaetales bacterium]
LWVEDDRQYHAYRDREADGLVSVCPGAVVCVSVADCLPIFVADRNTGAFGLLHSGWKGTGILGQALEMLLERGSRVSDLAVTLGPGIGSCCYAVEEERCRLFARAFGRHSVRRRHGQGYLDLQAANLEILRRAGVGEVAVVRACTACTPLLSSYRRDGSSFAHMLAFIGHIPRQES